MSLYNVGRVCLKIAGRDAGRKCVVVEQVDNNFVMIDGDVRRKKVNVKHLEPMDKILEIKAKASHDEVKKVFESLGLLVWDKKSKKPAARLKKQKKKKEVVSKKAAKKEKAKVKVEETPSKKEESSENQEGKSSDKVEETSNKTEGVEDLVELKKVEVKETTENSEKVEAKESS